MAQNSGSVQDEHGDYDDWIELYNRGDEPVNLAGCYLSDDIGNLTKWQIPAAEASVTTVAAHGYLLIWADGETDEGPLHASFKLAAGGEALALYDTQQELIDSLTFEAQREDVSYGRLPDGDDQWRFFEVPTPGASNGAGRGVVISEIMYHPYHALYEAENTTLEWIELFNPRSAPVRLAGWRLSDGVDCVLPDVVLEGGEYLVVAADVHAFTLEHPGVANVVGGWTGRLSNSGEQIELVDAVGAVADAVAYADEGDWAIRELGPVESGHRGWQWSDQTDGGGWSLELINGALPNESGQNWGASLVEGGTPGRANSVATSNIAPMVTEVRHDPLIPGPADPVTVTARVTDESVERATVRLRYRVDRSVYAGADVYPQDADDFAALPMFDDGAHGDAAADDGLYGASIPPHPDRTVIEFYVEAVDDGGRIRTWPAASLVDEQWQHVANALYRVDAALDPDTYWQIGGQPLYYLIMTEMERGRLAYIGTHSNLDGPNAQMNGTFISIDGTGTEFRYRVGIRNRGHGTRRGRPNNYHVNFPHDDPWRDVGAINFNSRYTHAQIIGSTLFRMAGIAAPDATPAQVRVNGADLAYPGNPMYGTYARLDTLDNSFAEKYFPGDPEGNLYTCFRVGSGSEADLRYEGPDPNVYRNRYFKANHGAQDDWSDLIHMLDVLNNAPEETFLQDVRGVIDLSQWLRYIALDSLLVNHETGLNMGMGDDYFMYSGAADPRFVLIPHDLDTILDQGNSHGSINQSIYSVVTGVPGRNGVDGLKRLFNHPDIPPLYHAQMLDLIETLFAPQRFDPLLDHMLGGWVPGPILDDMKDFAVRRSAAVLAQIPRQLTIESALPSMNGYRYTPSATYTLSGTADAVKTRSVLVNGIPAVWSPRDGTWQSGGVLGPADTLVGAGAEWKYLDDGSDQGEMWRLPGFDDSGWRRGRAQLGYGDNDEATVVNSGPTDDHHITTYFRRTFPVRGAWPYLALRLRLLRDDGAVVYLNGAEVWRVTMPGGPIDAATRASANISGQEEDTFLERILPPELLVIGLNVLAVEIHQASPTSADISFDLALEAVQEGQDAAALLPGVNRVMVQSFDGPDGAGSMLEEGYIDIWYEDGGGSEIGGVLASDTVLTPAAGPWHVTGTVTVPAGVTLSIEPGVTMFFDAATGIVVRSGGRLVVEGEPYARVRLAPIPGSLAHWDGIAFDHSLEDNRLRYVDMESGDGQGESVDVQHSRVLIEQVTWLATNTAILNLDHPTVTVRNCAFPSIDGTEPVHGVGLTGDECLVFERCTFGTATGYNDIIDFSGARRPGPILQIYDSVFLGGGDDGPDLDGADAHIEGNVFMNFRGGQGSDGTSNAIATGRSGSATEACIVRNLFVDNDNAILLKEDCIAYAENNTFVNTATAVVSFGEPQRNPPRTPGKGIFMAGNVFWGNAAVFEHFFDAPWPEYGPEEVIVDASILPAEWHVLGEGNVDADPLFVGEGDYHLAPMSPARGTGAWGLDMGAYVPGGAAVFGEPAAITHRTEAVLGVGGPGITHYRYSLSGPDGPWSEERPVDVPIELTALQDGRAYTVYVLGKNSAGRWQEQANRSRTWTVDRGYRRLVLNEVLAANATACEQDGTFPDLVELYYDGVAAIDLSGMMLSDDLAEPGKFIFPAGATMQPGEYLTLFAGADVPNSQWHVGFGLDADGDEVYLHDRDGQLLDSVVFGRQLPDLSIGRNGDEGRWYLTVPTFGQANMTLPVGDPDRVTINEWLAAGEVLFDTDFVELYNDQAAPVNVGGLYLTDDPVLQGDKYRLRPLSFIAAQGFVTFEADGDGRPGHVNFSLSADGEFIGLFAPDLREIDSVMYRPQTPDVSQGRSPDGSAQLGYFLLPTPGLPNPVAPKATVTPVTVLAEDAGKRAIVPTSPDHVAEDWNSRLDFDDTDWLRVSGAPGGVGYERSSGYEDLISLDVEERMYGRYVTCYVRIPFHVTSEAKRAISELYLNVRYDDGFVAYLNGVEVGRANFSGTPQWNSIAESSHEAGAQAFDAVLDLSDRLELLRVGENLLAIQSLNRSATSGDLIISAMLEGAIVQVEGGQEPSYVEPMQLLDGLRVTELMYNDPQGDPLDYIELQNISDELLDLTGIRFVEGVDFTFGTTLLAPQECVVVVGNLTAFRTSYGTGVRVAGAYAGRLSDNGEDVVLTLAAPFEAAIMRFRYRDDWHPTTDGGGMSLVIRDPAAAPVTWSDPASWRAAAPSPGEP